VRVQRGDEDNIRTEILSHIVQKIVSARLIIANISSRNPNVMYELGIAHALGKKVIVISSNEDEIPFDFRSRRLLFYKSRNDLISKLKEEIARKLFSGAL
jgi:nucleoside 2-deoxyribosyltransferase